MNARIARYDHRWSQGLAAAGLVVVTAGTLLPWSVPAPEVPGAIYVARQVPMPTAYHIRQRWLPLGTMLVLLSSIPVLATVIPHRYRSLALLMLPLAAIVLGMSQVAAAGLASTGAKVSFLGSIVQLSSLMWQAFLVEVQK